MRRGVEERDWGDDWGSKKGEEINFSNFKIYTLKE